jgi:hypothetical protein
MDFEIAAGIYRQAPKGHVAIRPIPEEDELIYEIEDNSPPDAKVTTTMWKILDKPSKVEFATGATNPEAIQKLVKFIGEVIKKWGHTITSEEEVTIRELDLQDSLFDR